MLVTNTGNGHYTCSYGASSCDEHRKTAVVIDVVIPSDSGQEHEVLVPVATGGLRAVMPKLLIFDNGEKGTVLDSCAPDVLSVLLLPYTMRRFTSLVMLFGFRLDQHSVVS